MLKKSDKRVVRASDLPIPKKITESRFRELCATFSISLKYRPHLRERLDTLITEFAEMMQEEALQPDRRRDRERVASVCRYLGEIETDIRNFGPTGRLAHISITPYVAPMVSWNWLVKNIPDLGSKVIPVRPVEVAEGEWDARHFLIERRSAQVMCSILSQLRAGYEAVLADFPKGGRRQLLNRRFFIINLSCFWESIDRAISSGPRSEFITFAEQVIEAVGWPTQGVAAEVPKAMNYWRNRGRNFRK